MSKKGTSLKKQIWILCAVFVVVILVIVSFSCFSLVTSERSHQEERAEITAASVEMYCNDLISQLENVCFLTVYNDLFYETFTEESGYMKIYEMMDYVSSSLANVIATDEMYKYISFTAPDGKLFIGTGSSGTGRNVDLADVYEFISNPHDLANRDRRRTYLGIIPMTRGSNKYIAYVEKVFFYQDGIYRVSDEPVLYMTLVCDMRGVCDELKKYETDPSDLFLIVNESGQVVASNRLELIGCSRTDVSTEGFADPKVQTLANNCWTLYTYSSTTILGEEVMTLLQISVFLATIVSVVLIVFVLVFHRRIVNPLFRVIRQLDRIPADIHGNRLECDAKNEVGELTDSINQMLDQVESASHAVLEAQEKLYASELARSKLRLAALQNQINPHFLYNTLECLRSIGSAYGVKEVSTISYSMSKIFRYCIKGKEIVTVEDELNIIQEYMSIIDIRFMGRHSARYEIEPEALKQPIIKMSLQPIVENAVYHGLEASDQDGHLVIRGSVDGGYLHFSIEDDGVGIEAEQLRELNESFHVQDQNYFNQSKRSIGLNNINMRCRLHYGERFRFRIESQHNRGTKVSMDIPLNNHSIRNEAKK